LSNEEKGMIMKILKKELIMIILKKGGGVVEKRGEEETKYRPHGPVVKRLADAYLILMINSFKS
jgi:hypothetical protein